ncbi:MAG: N-acetylmuramoyl-L-alanine amidase [Bacteroidota bacterium]|nr:N-acetylmuramoyl-L-alanine amidase [Bacteroidota bacterium]MDP4234640.1 N-acetylmuramoyl-L-alanine amidase [Bacteroidota bacterium]MDP4243805.1 N-acetylmuramoyl-L-alanine amidase [Bacteroidota bacterium]MDP4288604.1 N-acetylmuramoyl-L-alanine amidase [Bacteroidota bacterium]
MKYDKDRRSSASRIAIRALFIFHASYFLFLIGCAPSRKTTTTRPSPIPPPPTATKLPQPPAPAPEAPLHLSVAYPASGQVRPAVDSNFIFGTVGNGNATLAINGVEVPLARNGAFLAFLPMPHDGQYHLVAERGSDRQSLDLGYSPAKAAPAGLEEHAKTAYDAYPSPVWARVVRGSDTLQTGSDVAPGAPEPDGNRRWFFPRGTALRVLGKMGKYYKLELGSERETAWVADTNLDLHATAPTSAGMMAIRPTDGWIDIVMPAGHAPFLINESHGPEGNHLRVTIYRKPEGQSQIFTEVDPAILAVTSSTTGTNAGFDVQTAKPVWGYKAFYLDDGSLVLRLRRPPELDRYNPLRGLRIMIDPGHPPGGAIGPTGLTEREANLAEATRLHDLLTKKGAQVLMTHSTLSGMVSDVNQVEELDARAALAVSEDVDLMISVHNNAFPDGTNPFLNYGTSTFYYHPQSAGLAWALDREIAEVTGIPNLGAMQKSLAICRPTWMPCVLTESLYLMFPDQEQALRDPNFLNELAEAHVRGIEDFLRGEAQ